jgi:hypothetical protein
MQVGMLATAWLGVYVLYSGSRSSAQLARLRSAFMLMRMSVHHEITVHYQSLEQASSSTHQHVQMRLDDTLRGPCAGVSAHYMACRCVNLQWSQCGAVPQALLCNGGHAHVPLCKAASGVFVYTLRAHLAKLDKDY